MVLPLQAVDDPATDQNFRQTAQQFPIQAANIANGAVGSKALAKEAVIAEKLAASAKELFPQLVTAGSHKLAFGVTGEVTAGATVEVTHGLGGVPASILLTPLTASANLPVVPEAPTTTKFKVKNTGGVAIFAYWLAIG